MSDSTPSTPLHESLASTNQPSSSSSPSHPSAPASLPYVFSVSSSSPPPSHSASNPLPTAHLPQPTPRSPSPSIEFPGMATDSSTISHPLSTPTYPIISTPGSASRRNLLDASQAVEGEKTHRLCERLARYAEIGTMIQDYWAAESRFLGILEAVVGEMKEMFDHPEDSFNLPAWGQGQESRLSAEQNKAFERNMAMMCDLVAEEGKAFLLPRMLQSLHEILAHLSSRPDRAYGWTKDLTNNLATRLAETLPAHPTLLRSLTTTTDIASLFPVIHPIPDTYSRRNHCNISLISQRWYYRGYISLLSLLSTYEITSWNGLSDDHLRLSNPNAFWHLPWEIPGRTSAPVRGDSDTPADGGRVAVGSLRQGALQNAAGLSGHIKYRLKFGVEYKKSGHGVMWMT